MKIAVVTDQLLKEELLALGLRDGVEIVWLDEPGRIEGADACMDLLFNADPARIAKWEKIKAPLLLVNSTIHTLSALSPAVVRFNGWPSFLKRPVLEAACADIGQKEKAERIVACFNRKTEWVADIPGFISARVISMVINEAYFTLDENVSSKEEIDTAMKLGTNYPYGPFEWGRLISLRNIHALLLKMAETEPRYAPSALLQKEAVTE